MKPLCPALRATVGRAERGRHDESKKRLPLKPIPARRAMLIYFRKDTKHSFRYRV